MANESGRALGLEPYSQTVLICVSCQSQSKDLIHLGCQLAETLRAEVRVVCAIPSGTIPETEILDELFETCKEVDATMTVAFSAQAVPTIVRVAKRQGVQHIVMGRPAVYAPDSILSKVATLLPDAQLYWPDQGKLRAAVRIPPISVRMA